VDEVVWLISPVLPVRRTVNLEITVRATHTADRN